MQPERDGCDDELNLTKDDHPLSVLYEASRRPAAGQAYHIRKGIMTSAAKGSRSLFYLVIVQYGILPNQLTILPSKYTKPPKRSPCPSPPCNPNNVVRKLIVCPCCRTVVALPLKRGKVNTPKVVYVTDRKNCARQAASSAASCVSPPPPQPSDSPTQHRGWCKS
jgi:hypothetical protein